MGIVPRMIRTTILALALLAATQAYAQTSEFGILFGGSKRFISSKDEAAGIGVDDNFAFSNSVTEIYYAVTTEPDTRFKIKAGQITAPVAFQFSDGSGGNIRSDLNKGTINHIDGLIDYRFSEAWGSTGLFGGIGLYRQTGTVTDPRVPVAQQGKAEETNYGLSGGVNGDFPLNRRAGIIVEAAYHWINFHYKPRYATLSAGLRFSF
jgi:hypothetical protein